jgi:hypothetical protein
MGQIVTIDVEIRLTTEAGLSGSVVQDVVTNPPRKWGRLQDIDGFVEWHFGYRPGYDAVIAGSPMAPADEQLFEKTRPDHFIREPRHLEAAPRCSPPLTALRPRSAP